MEEHVQHLARLFSRFDEYGLSINVNKCVFAQPSVSFLGHTISAKGISSSTDKIKAILSYPKPKTVGELKRFLGMINFYHRFHRNMAALQAPLNLRGTYPSKTPLHWTPEMDEAFEKCRQALASDTTLAFPDPDAELSIMTDASNTTIGGAVNQTSNGVTRPLAFFSRRLTSAEEKYSTYDRELLAIYATIQRFAYLLEGRRFTIFTDHRPLAFAFTKARENFSPRQVLHLAYISQFSTTIQHVQGKINEPADALSRIDSIAKQTVSPATIAAAQADEPELADLLNSMTAGLKLRLTQLEGVSLYCDIATGQLRPYVPKILRFPLFQQYHSLSHPGGRSSSRMISRRFVWPYMQRDIKTWVRQCHDCQASKVHRHERTPLVHFLKPDARFAHVHVDLVGPLPTSRGQTYLLTCIDRYTRWLEALPMTDQSALTVAQTFFEGWISRFGTPVCLVTDQGRNFESALFQEVAKTLGIELKRTTAYHPQANGLIERQHRTLKSALMCRIQESRESWMNELPVVLLGMRASFKEDIQATASEMVYGTDLRLPGDFFDRPSSNPPTHDYVQKLRAVFSQLRPSNTAWHSSTKIFHHPDLNICTHVYIRQDGVKPSLQRPYAGPYKVVKRDQKTFQVVIGRRTVIVSRDRVKPAFTSGDSQHRLAPTTLGPINLRHPSTSSTQRTSQTQDQALPRTTTRSGRRVHFPRRLVSYIQ
ncbi:Reverse transcriptase (RNA-dependent DNA polymerase) [Nesidiocoris tenuis]|uniref:RNA-directed DNA polymerase n=2 Tax=Nesidiocoris tenuis TaxID=355587 RepID=A0ABN7A5E6_9HEMI|nr:Reverse transcriptase (RNA-dependent DNA polymerase) [Nesidiocoris tenuis]